MTDINFRTGFGYDVHKLVKGRKLILGGVHIPHGFGLAGHSDADVLLHSICDALLGATGFKDIGHQFPDTDNTYKDISSLILLQKTCDLISESNWKIGNTDSVIILEEPKIYKYAEKMKENISKITGTDNVSIKATTSEGIGFAGEKKGCCAYTTVLVYK